MISEKKQVQTHVDRKKQVQRVKQSCINVYQKSQFSHPSLIKIKWLALRKRSLKTNTIAIGLVSYFSILIFFQYLINRRSVDFLLQSLVGWATNHLKLEPWFLPRFPAIFFPNGFLRQVFSGLSSSRQPCFVAAAQLYSV